MGMFDWVEVTYPLAREHWGRQWQTKSVPAPALRKLLITTTGELYYGRKRLTFDGALTVYDLNDDVTVLFLYTFIFEHGHIVATHYRSEVVGDASNDEVRYL